jgi:pre-mRNA-splicing factor CWC22
VLKCVTITEEMTTSSSRIFLKIFFQELAENLGVVKFNSKIKDVDMKEYFEGLFPKDHPKNTRFAINFFSMIGLNSITLDLREELNRMTAEEMERLNQARAETSGDSSGTDGSSSSGSSDSDSSDSSDQANSQKSPKKIENPK